MPAKLEPALEQAPPGGSTHREVLELHPCASSCLREASSLEGQRHLDSQDAQSKEEPNGFIESHLRSRDHVQYRN